LLQAVVEQLNIGGLSLKEDGLKVKTIFASGSGITVHEHSGPQPQGERSEGFESKNKHYFRKW
jgi:hypothetical protein